MAVRPDLGQRRGLEEIEPVPERRQRIADLRGRDPSRRRWRSARAPERARQNLRRPACGRPIRAAFPVTSGVFLHVPATLPPPAGVERRASASLYTGATSPNRSGHDHVRRARKSLREEVRARPGLQFKATARKNKLLGLWAAGLMGKSGADAEAYAKEVVVADFEKPGDRDVIDKLVKDLAAAGKPTEDHTIRKPGRALAWSRPRPAHEGDALGQARVLFAPEQLCRGRCSPVGHPSVFRPATSLIAHRLSGLSPRSADLSLGRSTCFRFQAHAILPLSDREETNGRPSRRTHRRRDRRRIGHRPGHLPGLCPGRRARHRPRYQPRGRERDRRPRSRPPAARRRR